MKKRKLITILSITAFLLLLLCIVLFWMYRKSTQQEKESTQSENLSMSIVSSGDFEIDIFKQSFLDKEGDNIVISPLSIKIAMAMASEGANSYTLDELQTVLQINDYSKDGFKSVLEELSRYDGVTLNIANSVWSNKGFEFKQSYIDILTNHYKAEARSLDFTDSKSKDVINAWVDRKTEGNIKSIISDFNQEQVMFLINAIYFNADWSKKFNEDNTQERDFTLSNGSTIKVDSMSVQSTMKYKKEEGYEVVELPYGKDMRFLMRIYLPSESSSLQRYISDMTRESLEKGGVDLESREVALQLPKFKIEYSVSLREVLQKLGVREAFKEGIADFGNMIPLTQKEVYIGDVVHKTYIDVSEKGTEASASTSVEFLPTSSDVVQMIINRPFFFTIVDREKNSILFMSAIENPS